jgi:hypothetical protein
MGYTATHDELHMMATLVWHERPEWEPDLILVVLTSHAGQVDATDLAIAALRCAKNRDYPTPKAIGWRGPHWQGLNTMPPDVRPTTRCAVCGRTEADCYAVRPGPDDHRFTPKAVA